MQPKSSRTVFLTDDTKYELPLNWQKTAKKGKIIKLRRTLSNVCCTQGGVNIGQRFKGMQQVQAKKLKRKRNKKQKLLLTTAYLLTNYQASTLTVL